MAGTGLRTNHQSRVDWWRGQLQRQQKANLSVTELCRQLDVSITTFYYWRKRVEKPRLRLQRTSAGQVAAPDCIGDRAPREVRPGLDHRAHHGTQLEIELTNSCMVRLKGIIDPSLLQAAITAAGQLDGSREGAN